MVFCTLRAQLAEKYAALFSMDWGTCDALQWWQRSVRDARNQRCEVQPTELDGAFSDDPITWFLAARERACALEAFDVARAALATADADGAPSVRFVLVKVVDARGFSFFTNYESDKARELAANPRGALAFHWHSIGVQVRARGAVMRISESESDAYFDARPRESQLGAWASEQSKRIDDRAALDARLSAVHAHFAAVSRVPRPANWGGFRLVPDQVEVWQDREGRLHDRWSFTRGATSWSRVRLQP